eukprot:gene8766-1147_t
MADGSDADADADAAQESLPQIRHELILDGTLVRVSMNHFNEEIICPICLGIMQDTWTMMAVQHMDFATSQLSVFSNIIPMSKREMHVCLLKPRKKECPTCRAPCKSRRSLRPDKEFDAIIAVVYPSAQIYEEQQMALYRKIRARSNLQSMFQTMAASIRQQAFSRSRQARLPRRRARKLQPKPLPPTTTQVFSLPIMAEPRLVEATLFIHLVSCELNINHPYINATPDITAHKLKLFLVKDFEHHPEAPVILKCDEISLVHHSEVISDSTLLATFNPQIMKRKVIRIVVSQRAPTTEET